jgi:hypothetical protein
MAELKDGAQAYCQTGEFPEPKVFSYPLPFNIIPCIDKFQPNGYTKEEMKVSWEMKKIFGIAGDDLKISCTACRVPCLRTLLLRCASPGLPCSMRACIYVNNMHISAYAPVLLVVCRHRLLEDRDRLHGCLEWVETSRCAALYQCGRSLTTMCGPSWCYHRGVAQQVHTLRRSCSRHVRRSIQMQCGLC